MPHMYCIVDGLQGLKKSATIVSNVIITLDKASSANKASIAQLQPDLHDSYNILGDT